jgi:hypothetical protein
MRWPGWGRDLYPGPRWWNPLEPDLLGEHLVATELAGFAEVLAGVLQRDNPAALAQPLEVYARAVVAYPALCVVVGTVLSANLETLCRAAIGQAASQTNLDLLLGTTTAAEALSRVLTMVDVDPTALTAVDLFPVGAGQILGPLALTLAEKITEHFRQQVASDPAAYETDLASSLNNLSVRLAEAGRRDEGLIASRDAVEMYRRLAAANPAAYEPDLARSLKRVAAAISGAVPVATARTGGGRVQARRHPVTYMVFGSLSRPACPRRHAAEYHCRLPTATWTWSATPCRD